MFAIQQEVMDKERRDGAKAADSIAVQQPAKRTVANGVLALQRAAGNQAVNHLLQPDERRQECRLSLKRY